MEALVEDMLTLAKQGSAIDETEAVSLSTLVEECWTSVDTPDAESSLPAISDFERTRSRASGRAFENLFANAVTHGGPSIRVEVGPWKTGRDFTFRTTVRGSPNQSARRCSTPESRQTRTEPGSV